MLSSLNSSTANSKRWLYIVTHHSYVKAQISSFLIVMNLLTENTMFKALISGSFNLPLMCGKVSSLGGRVKLIFPTTKRLSVSFLNTMINILLVLSLLNQVRFITWDSFPHDPVADIFLGTSKTAWFV